MAAVDKYEIVVIGSGEAGKYLAWTMASAGHRTALVERRLIGGSCPNIACLPSKNVIYSAKMVSHAKRALEFGFESGPVVTSMKGVLHRKQKMVDGLVEMHLGRFKASGAELVMGEARFTGERSIEVALNAGGSRAIEGEKVFLSLGSKASIPDVPGLAAAEPMTHVEALELSCVPDRLFVLGAGYVGLELAQAMRRFGARVTVIERGPQIASREDPDVGLALLELLRDEGIEVLLETAVGRVAGRSGEMVRISVEGPRGKLDIEGTHILAAAGRTPNTRSIGLDKTGVDLDERGYIVVNERLQTTAKNIWAMGDCAGSPQFTHAAYDDFRIIRDNLSGGNRTTQNCLIPFCLFTDPELVRVGCNETEAKRQGIQYRLATMPIAAVLKTRTVSEPRGFMKMLIEAQSDRILGFTAFGVDASELLAAVQTAILGNLPYTVVRDGIYAHPTIAEGLVFLLANVPSIAARQSGAAG